MQWERPGSFLSALCYGQKLWHEPAVPAVCPLPLPQRPRRIRMVILILYKASMTLADAEQHPLWDK